MRELIQYYRETKNDDVFSEIYKKVQPAIEQKKKYYLSRGLEEHDIIEGCDEALLESLENWDHTKSGFITFFKTCADMRIIDVRRKKIAKYEKEIYEPDEWENDAFTFYESHQRLEDFPTVEEKALQTIVISDQRKLIATIIKEVDEQLRQQLLIIAEGRSANYAASKFKMHHQTLNRKLARLSHIYKNQWQDVCLHA